MFVFFSGGGGVRRCWSTPRDFMKNFQTSVFLRKFFAAWVKRNWKRFCWMPSAGGPLAFSSPVCWMEKLFKKNESYKKEGDVFFLSWFEVGNPINPWNYMFFGCKWKRETPLLDEFYGGIHWKFVKLQRDILGIPELLSWVDMLQLTLLGTITYSSFRTFE